MNSLAVESELRTIREQLHDLKPMIWRIDRDTNDLLNIIERGAIRVKIGWLSALIAIAVIEGAVLIALLYRLVLGANSG